MNEFSVSGKPATKGSTRSFLHRRTGRIVTVADNKNLGAWTAQTQIAAKVAGVRMVPKPHQIHVEVKFEFARPKRDRHRTVHSVKPDIDKCLRAVLDALTGVAYEDDAQVASITATKSYGVFDQCHIRVSRF